MWLRRRLFGLQDNETASVISKKLAARSAIIDHQMVVLLLVAGGVCGAIAYLAYVVLGPGALAIAFVAASCPAVIFAATRIRRAMIARRELPRILTDMNRCSNCGYPVPLRGQCPECGTPTEDIDG